MTITVVGELTERERDYYIQRGYEKYGSNLAGMTIETVSDEEVTIDYELNAQPFERVRRITGYLVGTLDKWNDAKRAEEQDRVKHDV